MSRRSPTSPSIAAFAAYLHRAGLDLDSEAIADALWLAQYIDLEAPPEAVPQQKTETAVEIESLDEPPPPDEPIVSIYPEAPPTRQAPSPSAPGLPFQSPGAPALRQPLDLARSLRSLMRKVPSQSQTVLDEEETARRIAEQALWVPVLKPASERWLELALVVEESRSTMIWQETILEFQQLVERQGAFRDVRTWSLAATPQGIYLQPKRRATANQQRYRSPKELLDAAGRRLILLVSDCTSPLWRDGKIHALLRLWADAGPVAIVQLLPERLWSRSALGVGFPVQLRALLPGGPNTKLLIEGKPEWEEIDEATALPVPIITLEPDSLKQWTKVVAGVGDTRTAGILFDLAAPNQPRSPQTANRLHPEELVKRFRLTASPLARRLAGLMAAAPVHLPVIHLIQKNLLPDSMQVHVAEVFMSGLLQPAANGNTLDGEAAQYAFVDGVRGLLLDSVPISETEKVLEAVSRDIAQRAGISIKSFAALLMPKADWDETTRQTVQPFAELAGWVLRRLGGEYAALAEQLERRQQPLASSPAYPPLQTFEFEVAAILAVLQVFSFQVASIEIESTGFFRRTPRLVIKRQQQRAWSFTEALGSGVRLEIVNVPAGSFLMGSPEDEPERSDSEGPQHEVKIQSFFLGKYPVTQAQWKAVAALPQVKRDLRPDPSRFKGDNRPVESVSWLDAVEFCDRLSHLTGKLYRLPSEAEWEYACRAGTTTPFHFGETITTDLANYNGNTYKDGPKGEFHKKTTPVDRFGTANAFGLCDMHGNVWEWCQDHWHDSYDGAPPDGSAWFNENENDYHVLRGGSWIDDPWGCRSAYRDLFAPDNALNFNLGFRVVCLAPRTS